MTHYIPQLPVSQVFAPVQAPTVAKRPNPTDASSPSVNAKKAKVSPQEKALLIKGRPGPVATIFMKAKPAPGNPEPQPADMHNAEILAPRWSDDDEGSVPDDDVEPKDGVVVNPNGLVQLSYPKKKVGRHPGGAPRNDLMDQFLMYCYSEADGLDVKKWGCIGRCGRTWTTRNFNCVLKHASECRKLTTTNLRELARDKSAEKAPSQKLENRAERHRAEEPKTTKSGPNKQNEKIENSHKVTVFNSFQIKGKANRDEAINLAVIRFICAAGLPTHIVSYQEWTDLLNLLCPSYHPPNRSMLEDDLIVSEANKVRRNILTQLRNQWNLTISFDGGTSRGRDSYWTIHVSTEERKVHLLETILATDVSHTAQWIEEQALGVRIFQFASIWFRLTCLGNPIHWTFSLHCCRLRQYRQHAWQ